MSTIESALLRVCARMNCVGAALLALALCYMGVQGCGPTRSSVASRATFSVCAVAVTRWDDYKQSLQPTFDLKAADALTQSVPTTGRLEESMFDALKVGARLKIAPADVLPAGFGTDGSGSGLPTTLTSTLTPTEGSKPQTISSTSTVDHSPFLKYLAATALFQEVQLLNRYVVDANIADGYRPYVVQFLINQDVLGPTAGFDTDIVLSFFGSGVTLGPLDGAQIAMLNAVRRPSFLLSLPSGMSPGRRLVAAQLERLGEIGVNDTKKVQEISENLKQLLKEERMQWTPEEQVGLMETLAEIDSLIASAKKKRKDEIPLVLPMLVTDEVESSLHASRAEQLKQMSLTLAAAYAGVGGQVDLEKVSRQIRAALRSDVNNRFSISRVNDNSVRIHLGAKMMPSSELRGEPYEHAADERNHRATLLVLVPQSWVESNGSEIFFSAESFRSDSATGGSLGPAASDAESVLLAMIEGPDRHPMFDPVRLAAMGLLSSGSDAIVTAEYQLQTLFGPTSEGRVKFMRSLESDVRNGKERYSHFRSLVDSVFIAMRIYPGNPQAEGLANSLWQQLAVIAVGSRFQTGSFQASTYPPSAADIASTVAVIIDDSKTATATISGAKDIDTKNLLVNWTFSDGDPASPRPVTLGAVSSSLSGTGSVLTISFPSVKAMGLKPATTAGSNGSLQITGGGLKSSKSPMAQYRLSPEAKEAGLKILRAQNEILASDGRVTLHLDLSDDLQRQAAGIAAADFEEAVKNEKFYMLKINGGMIDKTSTDPAFPADVLKRSETAAPLHFAVLKSGTVTLRVTGLGSKMTLQALPAKGHKAPEPLEFTVVVPRP